MQTPVPSAMTNEDEDDDNASTATNGYSTDDEDAQHVNRRNMTVTLRIIDLAGSERSKRTRVMQGTAQQKEAAIVNSCLMMLMHCLSVMRINQSGVSTTAKVQTPFRESKLSHLFMNHLTGPSANCTVMILYVSPSVVDFDETKHVLKYATAARTVQNSQDKRHHKSNMEATHDYNGRALKTFNSSRGQAEPALKPNTNDCSNDKKLKMSLLTVHDADTLQSKKRKQEEQLLQQVAPTQTRMDMTQMRQPRTAEVSRLREKYHNYIEILVKAHKGETARLKATIKELKAQLMASEENNAKAGKEREGNYGKLRARRQGIPPNFSSQGWERKETLKPDTCITVGPGRCHFKHSNWKTFTSHWAVSQAICCIKKLMPLHAMISSRARVPPVRLFRCL